RSGRDLPVIIVSGQIGEEFTVAAMRAGAHDYVMKDNLARLVPAIERELHEAKVHTAPSQAEEALRQSEERFGNAFQYAPIGMAVVSIEGRVLQANRALGDMLGYTPEEMVGKSAQDVTHPDEYEREARLFTQLFDGQIRSVEIE